jgi:hypothetical protein
VDNIPVLGTGKTDYVKVTRQVLEEDGSAEEQPVQGHA